MASCKLERRKALGKCLRCKGLAPIGQAVCFDCTDKMTAGKQAALAAGLCVQCWKQPKLEGKRYCAACDQKVRTKSHQRYHQRKQAGVCTTCGQAPAWHGRVECAYCWGKRYGL